MNFIKNNITIISIISGLLIISIISFMFFRNKQTETFTSNIQRQESNGYIHYGISNKIRGMTFFFLSNNNNFPTYIRTNLLNIINKHFPLINNTEIDTIRDNNIIDTIRDINIIASHFITYIITKEGKNPLTERDQHLASLLDYYLDNKINDTDFITALNTYVFVEKYLEGPKWMPSPFLRVLNAELVRSIITKFIQVNKVNEEKFNDKLLHFIWNYRKKQEKAAWNYKKYRK